MSITVSPQALRSFSQPLAIIDLETTGGRALCDRITEVGVILIDEQGVREWSSLINPEVSIPPFITQLTGISNDTVARHGVATVAAAVQLLNKRPTLPAYLDESLTDEMPECPGVYLFHGEAGMLYVGKAVNIRSRVLSHFAADLKDAKEMRLSQQVRRITWETTAGELGALLR